MSTHGIAGPSWRAVRCAHCRTLFDSTHDRALCPSCGRRVSVNENSLNDAAADEWEFEVEEPQEASGLGTDWETLLLRCPHCAHEYAAPPWGEEPYCPRCGRSRWDGHREPGFVSTAPTLGQWLTGARPLTVTAISASATRAVEPGREERLRTGAAAWQVPDAGVHWEDALSGLTSAVVGALLLYLGRRQPWSDAFVIGVALLLLAAFGALVTSFWRRYQHLDGWPYFVVRLPSNVLRALFYLFYVSALLITSV
jgi:Zn finger protein HypA/HybF involved in hydrogenase expression